MAVHRKHPGSVPHDELDPGCERCQEMVLGELDDDHLLSLVGMTRQQLEDHGWAVAATGYGWLQNRSKHIMDLGPE